MLRLINFAHSEVFMYGTFAALWAVMALGGHAGAGVASVIGLDRSRCSSPPWSMSGRRSRLGLERFAYRPLRKRNAPALIALISAIGASFVLSELMGLRDKPLAVVRSR